MTIAPIADNEAGSSVRTKLNAAIDGVNGLLDNPISYAGDPTGLLVTVTTKTILRNDAVYSGPAAVILTNTVDGLTALHFGAVQIVSIEDLSSTSLTTLDFGDATVLMGGAGGTLNAVTTFTADALEKVTGNWHMTFGALTTMSLPTLRSGELSFIANALTTLSLPAYEDDNGGGMDFTANTLVTLGFPVIVRSGYNITITAASLQNLTFGATLKSIAGDVSIFGAALTQSSVNGVLVRLAALDGTGGTTSYDNHTINLSGGTSASPSGAGLTAKATLEGRGCTVTVN